MNKSTIVSIPPNSVISFDPFQGQSWTYTIKQMNITEDFKEPIEFTEFEEVEKQPTMEITYERYDTLLSHQSENERLVKQIGEFKKSVFYKLYDFFNNL